jgi:hypothetical protein
VSIDIFLQYLHKSLIYHYTYVKKSVCTFCGHTAKNRGVKRSTAFHCSNSLAAPRAIGNFASQNCRPSMLPVWWKAYRRAAPCAPTGLPAFRAMYVSRINSRSFSRGRRVWKPEFPNPLYSCNSRTFFPSFSLRVLRDLCGSFFLCALRKWRKRAHNNRF